MRCMSMATARDSMRPLPTIRTKVPQSRSPSRWLPLPLALSSRLVAPEAILVLSHGTVD
jgi:hypothetical protein